MIKCTSCISHWGDLIRELRERKEAGPVGKGGCQQDWKKGKRHCIRGRIEVRSVSKFDYECQ